MKRPKIITIEVEEDGLSVCEVDNTPYSAPINRSGFYNMTFNYFLKNEFPIWSETAHIFLHAGEESIRLTEC